MPITMNIYCVVMNRRPMIIMAGAKKYENGRVILNKPSTAESRGETVLKK